MIFALALAALAIGLRFSNRFIAFALALTLIFAQFSKHFY